jgi:hypothetical protein
LGCSGLLELGLTITYFYRPEDFFGLFLVVTGLVHRHLLPGLDKSWVSVSHILVPSGLQVSSLPFLGLQLDLEDIKSIEIEQLPSSLRLLAASNSRWTPQKITVQR